MPLRRIRLRGVVQGVGMRPTLWRLARQLGIRGTVANDGTGVVIEAWGSREQLDQLIAQIPLQLPPGARLEACDVSESAIIDADEPDDFRMIVAPTQADRGVAMAPDTATCPQCLAELHDPAHRRYRYPFTHCAVCGPRWSIVRQLPYERPHTSMADFLMCDACQAEYTNPDDRRFHAQTICCPQCGPRVWLSDGQQSLPAQDALQQAAALIGQGYIVAIKGLGGFQLACDASNAEAVQRLRQRKQRDSKPLALMMRDMAMVRRYAHCNDREQHALCSAAAPIVLLTALAESALPATVAMGSDRLGVMLPYTPLHSLLLADLAAPVVLTSGNRSDEPPCTDNATALVQLAGIADYWLLHDRTIEQRLDDSVVCELDQHIRVLRRARGYVPATLNLPDGFSPELTVQAAGGELKTSFCCVQQQKVMMSPYLGDLEQPGVLRQYQQLSQDYQRYFLPQAQCLAVDRHHGYLSTQYLRAQALSGQAVQAIQHHHAHLAACLLEYGIAADAPPVLAAIFDGLGMGDDGRLWGAEFLRGDYRHYQRLAHFPAIALPGGTQAIRQPWRNTYAHLRHYFDWPRLCQRYQELPLMQFLADKPLLTLQAMLDQGINSPLCSSAGRWFDAFAAALGLHAEQISHEAQAAIALEVAARPRFDSQHAYADAWHIDNTRDVMQLTWRGLWRAVLDDLSAGTAVSDIAARIHHSLIEGCLALLLQLSRNGDAIVLSGGVMQNALLLNGLCQQLRAQDRQPLVPAAYPMNDGGLALGQAAIASARYTAGLPGG